MQCAGAIKPSVQARCRDLRCWHCKSGRYIFHHYSITSALCTNLCLAFFNCVLGHLDVVVTLALQRIPAPVVVVSTQSL